MVVCKKRKKILKKNPFRLFSYCTTFCFPMYIYWKPYLSTYLTPNIQHFWLRWTCHSIVVIHWLLLWWGFIYQFLVNTKDFLFHSKVLVIKHFHKLNTFVNCYTYLLMYACIFYVGEGPTFAFSFTVPRKLVGMYVHNSSPL